MKKNKLFIIVLIIVFVNSCSKNNNEFEQHWKQVDNILASINQPVFNNVEFNVIEFGAKPDSTFDSKNAIQKAIDECSNKGGGKVVIPEGKYFSAGTIFLKSNVNLYLQNAKINFSTKSKDFLPIVFSRWEGIELFNYSALIYAKDQANIAITGKGTLNGNASSKNWWPWKGKKEYGFEDGMPSQLDSSARPRLLNMNNNQLPVEERIFGEGYYLRPNFFQTINCKNILIDGITFKDSPMWFLHPVLSENIIVRNVIIEGHGPNNDGFDPESCKNILVEDCLFNTGDDCIAIKSGRNTDGRRINIPSENIVIRNCKMMDGHGGVVVGSEISGGCKNVFVENCEMDSPNLDRAIRIKTNTIRGGVVENIFVRNIRIGEVKEAVLRINLLYEPDEIGERNFLPKVRNIYLSDIISSKSERAFYMDGLENSTIDNITVSNSQFNGVEKSDVLKNVINFRTENVYINNKNYKN